MSDQYDEIARSECGRGAPHPAGQPCSWCLIFSDRLRSVFASKDAELARLREAVGSAKLALDDCFRWFTNAAEKHVLPNRSEEAVTLIVTASRKIAALSSSPSGEAEAVERVVVNAVRVIAKLRFPNCEHEFLCELDKKLAEAVDALAALRSAKPSQEKKG